MFLSGAPPLVTQRRRARGINDFTRGSDSRPKGLSEDRWRVFAAGLLCELGLL